MKLTYGYGKIMIFYGYHLKQKIYLKEHTSCLLLHFSKKEDMMEYIQELVKKGYVIE